MWITRPSMLQCADQLAIFEFLCYVDNYVDKLWITMWKVYYIDPVDVLIALYLI